jgi:hypothetical protein
LARMLCLVAKIWQKGLMSPSLLSTSVKSFHCRSPSFNYRPSSMSRILNPFLIASSG